jgi:hypothetical protein
MPETKCDRCGGTFSADKMVVQEFILAETDTVREQSGGKITTTSTHRNFVPAPVALCGSCSARILKRSMAGMSGLMAFFFLLFLVFTLAVGDPWLIALTSILFLAFVFYAAATLVNMSHLRRGTFASVAKIFRIQRPENFLREVAAEKAPRLLKNPERAVGWVDRDGLVTRSEGYAILSRKEFDALARHGQPLP